MVRPVQGLQDGRPRLLRIEASLIAARSGEQIDDYLRDVDEPKRSALQALRLTILEAISDAEQGLSYGMPAFRVRGSMVAGIRRRSRTTSATCRIAARSLGSLPTSSRATR